MMTYQSELLALIEKVTSSKVGQMTVSRGAGLTYPDPAKTSFNESVSWRVELTFGTGYFQGAIVRWVGKWSTPHDANRADPFSYSDQWRELPVADAITTFLSDTVPSWAAHEMRTTQ